MTIQLAIFNSTIRVKAVVLTIAILAFACSQLAYVDNKEKTVVTSATIAFEVQQLTYADLKTNKKREQLM